MRKLSLAELGRMNNEEHRKAQKLPVIVVLDNLRSQHNIGSIFRTADAFRFEAIYLCGISATPPQREMNKTALGATESVAWKYFETTLYAIEELKAKGYKICSVEQTEGSTPLSGFEIPAANGLAVVFGNEVTGVDQSIVDASDFCVEIPQYGTKHSLNVAVSAGIISWEIVNQFIARHPGIIS
ncbi:MAG: RNA methyltransferase [Bacteroidales bacterium]|nr:RNA methyltransferase [Bacteroidales bacterium]